MRSSLISLFVLGCSRPQAALPPITEDDVTVLAARLVTAAVPCDVNKVSELLDGAAFRARVGGNTLAIVEGVSSMSIPATKWCAWMSGVESYRFLRPRIVDGQLRAVMRRSTRFSASYHEVALVRSDDRAVRIADVYSYFKGQWLSEEIAGLQKAGDDPAAIATAMKIGKAAELEKAAPAEALAVLDTLPPKVLALRSIQGWRVKLSQSISIDAYKAALDELGQRFPDDPSVALLQIDRAVLDGDIVSALRYLDIVDAAVGPDAFLDGTRAVLLVMRNAPGDVDAADATVQRAMKTEPDVATVLIGRIAVAVGRRQWAGALTLADEAIARFRLPMAEAFRSQPIYDPLRATQEDAVWQAQHP